MRKRIAHAIDRWILKHSQRRKLVFGMLVVMLGVLPTGCYVNRASYDPFTFAPEDSCSYWSPDARASELACELTECVDVPNKECILSLAEVLDIALMNNPETKISWAQARQAAAEYGQSQSTAFPQITGYAQHIRSRTSFLASQVTAQQNVGPEELIVSTQSEWGPRTNLTYTLLDFGQRRYTSEAARYALYYADFTHNRMIQSVMEQTTLDFYNYLFEKKQLEANEADLANAEETLSAAELGLQKGVKNISDVLQARTQALQAEIQLSQQHKALKKAYATFLNTIGLPANAEINIQKLPFVDPDSYEVGCLDCYLDLAMENRPDLLAARANTESFAMNLKAAKRAWTPVLDYTMDIGRTHFSGGFSDYDYVSTFKLSMPLFTGFHIRNSIRLARAKLEEAEATLKEKELDVVKEVTTAHYNIQVAFNTLKAAVRFLQAAQEQYQVALSQYRAGVNTILDVTTAQSALFDARATQAQATQQWFSTLATLTYSTGIVTCDIKRL